MCRSHLLIEIPLLFALLALSACGGSGASTPNQRSETLNKACASSTDGLVVIADGSVPAGKAAGASVFGCQNSPREVKWAQTAGAPVTVYADRMQAMSFVPPTAGSYSFNLSVTDAQGVARSQVVTVNAAAAPATNFVSAKVDQSVFGGSDVSLRAMGTAAATYAWQQVDGPTVALKIAASDATLAQFVAPNVDLDDVLKFRVTATFADGTTDSDDVLVVVQQQKNLAAKTNSALFSGIKTSPVHAYKSTGKYAGVLASCVYDTNLNYTNATNNNVCPFSKLPLIGQESGGFVPTVEQVMDHVVVSHDWMGANFENYLRTQDASGDLRTLLGSVTAVVIGSHVRPSFYYIGTGAIYLDAENLWLTAAERDVINEAPDYRSSFGNELQYTMLWRYTINNLRARQFFPRTGRTSRSVDYLVYELGDLLYHELAHANDFLPASSRASLSLQTNPINAAGNQGSDLLLRQYPLISQPMKELAQVNFKGTPSTAAQKTYTAAQVAGFFAPDRGTDEYSFYTQYEDFAMLHEEFMMLYRHGVARNVAVTGPITSTTTGDNLIVAWGQRGRITEPTIKPRLKTVLQQISPGIDPNAIDTLGAPIPMRAGQSWNANLVLPGIPGGNFSAQAEGVRETNDEFNHAMQRMYDKSLAHQLSENAAIKLFKLRSWAVYP
jgi:hypothetical protein